MKNRKKPSVLETRITLLKIPKGALIYTFKRNPSNWEFGISFESKRSEKQRVKRVTASKKKEPAPKEAST